MLHLLYAVASLSFVAFIVWLIGFAIHQMRGVVPGAGWCFVSMICCAVMTASNLLGLLFGNFFAIMFLIFTGYGTFQYFKLWRAQCRGW